MNSNLYKNRELPYKNVKTRSDYRLSKAAKYLIEKIEYNKG